MFDRYPRLLNLLTQSWGLVLACVLCRHFFMLPAGQFFENHDADGYGLRILEFRDCLRAGAVFPQWCSHFRGGLGTPFFNYYQPGFFYAAALTPPRLPLAQQIGLTVCAFSIIGYLGMVALVRRHFGPAAGTLAGTLLLTVPYSATELYIRGDFSEFAAMMLVPGLLCGLTAFANEPSRRSGILGALCGGAVVMTHPAVALATYGLLAAALLIIAGGSRQIRPALRGLTLLGCGAGLASFYWLPVFLEAGYVSADEAWSGRLFDGYYHYSKHFIPLTWMFNRAVTQTPIPVKLGLTAVMLLALGGLAVSLRWRQWDLRQRWSVALLGLLLAGGLFLITPQSRPVWDHLPLLERLQFPWRLLSLVSVAIAGLGGLSPLVTSHPTVRRAALLLAAGVLVTSLGNRAAPRPIAIDEPATAAAIADRFFAPDLADEWLPRGAQRITTDGSPLKPFPGPRVVVANYQLHQGLLTCDLQTEQESFVVLPHYSFPVGWTATLNDAPVSVGRVRNGLMRIALPANFSGRLRVAWKTTPAKWIGAALSLLTAVAGGWGLRRFIPADGAAASPQTDDSAPALRRHDSEHDAQADQIETELAAAP